MFKHAVLFSALNVAREAQHDWLYMETHAAAGTYDLQDNQSRKTKEAEDGVLRLLKKPPTGSAHLQAWLDFVEKRGPNAIRAPLPSPGIAFASATG